MENTKGDWTVQNKGTLGARSARCEVVEGKVNLSNLDRIPYNPTVCRMPDLSSESYANAHLIAAAPDMYEALKFIITGKRENGKYDKHDAAGFIKIAEDALAKADER